jgi:hypothetical protein
MGDLVLETKLFNLSTRGSACNVLNSNPDYKSLCEYDIPSMIVRDESVEYIQFSITDMVIPVSFYTINENNNRLYVNGIPYDFPYGNYNANLFITQFKTLLGTDWNITLNSFNSVFTITNSKNSFTFNDTSTIDSVMGFSTTLSSTTVSPYTLTLTRCCNFFPLPRVTFRCPELANTNMISSTPASDVIITVANNSKPNGQIYYQNQSQSKLLFRHHELSRFVIKITDDDGNLINFNGVSCFFTFRFDIFRKYVPKPPRFGNIVEYVNSKTNYLYEDEEEPIEANV